MRYFIIIFLLFSGFCYTEDHKLISNITEENYADSKLFTCPQCGKKCYILNTIDEKYWACDECFYGKEENLDIS